MKDAEGKCVPWLASQTDMLAEDWMIVGEGRAAGDTVDEAPTPEDAA